MKILLMLILIGCQQEAKIKPDIVCIKKCVQWIIEDSDEPFEGSAIKEYRNLCEEQVKAVRCTDLYRGWE